MTHTLQLYKTLPFDNATRMPLFSSLASQNTYMNAHSDRTVEVNFNKIGDPIIVQLPYEDAIAYSYGRISFGSKWVYFSITDVTVVQEGKVEISYKIDAWATGRYQYNVTLGRTQVTRRNLTGSHPKQPIEPIDMTVTAASLLLRGQRSIVFVLSQLKINPSEPYFDGPFYCVVQIPTSPLSYDITSAWYSPFTTAGYFTLSDVLGAWYVPVDYGQFSTQWTEIVLGEIHMRYTDGHLAEPQGKISFTPVYTDDLHTGVFTDEKGIILYIVPYGRNASSAYWYLRITALVCQMEIKFNDAVNANVDNHGFTYVCKPIDVIIDAWSDYCSRSRQYEKDLRTLQNQKAVVSSLAGVGESGMQGAVAGGLTKAGGPAGAVAGLGISVGSALLSYGINNYYDPKFQGLEDAKYRQAQDTLSIAGDSLTDLILTQCPMIAAELQADQYTITRYNNTIVNGGYFCNEFYTTGENLMIPQPLQCNTEIIGELPDNWKAQIYQRFATGVKLIEVA